MEHVISIQFSVPNVNSNSIPNLKDLFLYHNFLRPYLPSVPSLVFLNNNIPFRVNRTIQIFNLLMILKFLLSTSQKDFGFK